MAEPEPKEYRVYRGELVEVSKIQEYPIAVQRPGPTGKLPRLSVLKAITASWRFGHKTLTLWDPDKGDVYIEVKEDDKLVNLTGTRGRALLGAFGAWGLKNITAALPIVGKHLGSDPEIFVVDENDAVIPSWEFLPPKKTPLPLYGSNGAYWDGFQAEYTTSPHACMAYFVDDIQAGLYAIHQAAKKYNPKAHLSPYSVLPVDPEILRTAKDEHVEFGCMPSKNIYGLHGNTIPGRQVPLRFAGGHIHLGLKLTTKQLEAAVRGIDAVLGVPSVSLFAAFDIPARREYYGQAGEYRLPAHGLEYRTLSNAWLMHPVLTHLVYELARVGVDYGISGFDAFGAQEEIRDIIQGTDFLAARAFMTRHKDLYLSLFKRAKPFSYSSEQAYGAFFNGADTFIKDPADFESNWSFGDWVGHSDGPLKNWGNAYTHIAAGAKL